MQARAKPEPIKISSVLGVAEVLSDADQIDLYACEAVVETASSNVFQVGLAFAGIRDGKLYRMEFQTFEAYCRHKWQYGRNYVNRMILAAQLFTHLVTTRHQKPDHETQLRPLIGLPLEQAEVAWENAVTKAGGRKITAQLVRRTVKELKSEAPGTPEVSVAPKPRVRMAAHRQMIDDAIGQLLLLLSQKASHDILTEKVEALHGYFQALFLKALKH